MKRFTLLAILLASLSVLTFTSPAAAEKKSDWAYHKVERMQKDLGLSDEQANEIFSIYEKLKSMKEQCRSLKKFTEQRDCRKKRREAKHKEIMSVLTKEQKAEYKKYKKDKRGRSCAHHEKGSYCDKCDKCDKGAGK